MPWDAKLEKNPVSVDPMQLVRQYMSGATGARFQTTVRMTADEDLNTLMVDDIDYRADLMVYLSKKKRYDNQ